MPIEATRPGKNICTKSLLFSAGIGSLILRFNTSSGEGAGIFSNRYTTMINGTANTNPVKKGTQNSLAPNCMIRPATVLTNPEEKIKLTERAAPIKSVALLPSTYEKIIPQIIPSGKPFMSINGLFHGAGTNAKKKSPAHEDRKSTRLNSSHDQISY